VLGAGLAGAGLGGGGVATGSCPDLKRWMSFTTSLSSRMLSMKSTWAREMIIGSFGSCASLPRLMSCVPDCSDVER